MTEVKLKFFATPQGVISAILFLAEQGMTELGEEARDDIKLITPHIGLCSTPVPSPTERAYAKAAHGSYNYDGDIEIAENTAVSKGEDDGAYVLAWKWITDEEAGICSRCGAVNANNGEGYEGVCGSCADKDFAENDALYTSHWDDDAQYPVEAWQAEVANGDTRQSYSEWVESQKENDAAEEAEQVT